MCFGPCFYPSIKLQKKCIQFLNKPMKLLYCQDKFFYNYVIRFKIDLCVFILDFSQIYEWTIHCIWIGIVLVFWICERVWFTCQGNIWMGMFFKLQQNHCTRFLSQVTSPHVVNIGINIYKHVNIGTNVYKLVNIGTNVY